MIDIFLIEKLEEIYVLCLKHSVSKLYAFGSIVDGRFEKGKSDVDLLVEFEEIDKKLKAKVLFTLWVELQNTLDCKVDLITADKVQGKYFKKYLNLYKVLIFEKE